VYRVPNLAQKLVSEMTDRTRETTRMVERTEKMLALGKLSAGLAHELNNPASAVVRSAAMLRETLTRRRRDAILMKGEVIPPQARPSCQSWVSRSTNAELQTTGDSLERADLASDLADWLEQQNAPSELAGDLVDAGISVEQLDPLSKIISHEAFSRGLRILVCDYQILLPDA